MYNTHAQNDQVMFNTEMKTTKMFWELLNSFIIGVVHMMIEEKALLQK